MPVGCGTASLRPYFASAPLSLEVASSVCTLTVTDKPTITSAGGVGPISESACKGSTKILTVSATTPCGSLSYVWSLDGDLLPNSTNVAGVLTNSLTLTNVNETSIGQYTCAVTDARGTSTVTINLFVDYLTVSLPNQVSYSQCTGTQFLVTLPNPETSVVQTNVSYQWYGPNPTTFAVGPISGATSKTLTINNVQLGHSGNYYCVASIGATSCGATTTASTQSLGNITLSVNRAPVVTTSTANQTLCPGNTFSASVTATGGIAGNAASGDKTLSYRWKKAGNNVNEIGRAHV